MSFFLHPHPKVSVAMCTYNGFKYLREQIQSINEQTLQPSEIVVCDDGSTDATIDLLTELAQTSSIPIHVHRNETNLGVVANFEKAISLCKGDFIALSDQDDVWVPNKIATILEHFSHNPTTCMIFTNAFLGGAGTNNAKTTLWDSLGFSPADRRLFTCVSSGKIVAKSLLVTGATVVFRAAFKASLLPFPKGKPTAFLHDEWMAIAASAEEGLEGLDQNLIHYRIHSEQTAGLPDVRDKQLAKKVSQELGRTTTEKKVRLERMAEDARFVADLLKSRAENKHSLTAKMFECRAQFFSVRASLPEAKLRRVIPVLYAALQKQYGRFCRRPLLAALQDILA